MVPNRDQVLGKWYDAPSVMPIKYVCQAPAPPCASCLDGQPDCDTRCSAEFGPGFTGTCPVADSTDPASCCVCNEAPKEKRDEGLPCAGCLNGHPNCNTACSDTFGTGYTGWCAAPASTDIRHCCSCVSPRPPMACRGGSCYTVSTRLESFSSASKSCAKDGGTLAVIRNADENNLVQELCGAEACWIGLSEPPKSESYIWSDGTAAGKKGVWKGYTNWNPGEPNNWHGDEDAAFMNYWGDLGLPPPWEGDFSLGKWYDAPRSMPIKYVCQKYGSCGIGGRPVLAPGLAPEQIREHVRNFRNSCYVLSSSSASFDDATANCKRWGGALVVIRDAAENAVVQELCGREACWIGLSEPPNSESYVWSDGTEASSSAAGWKGYTNWMFGEPNNYAGRDEDAAFMNFWGNLGMPEPWLQEAERSAARYVQRFVMGWNPPKFDVTSR